MSLVNDMLRDLDRRRRQPVNYDTIRQVFDADTDGSGGRRTIVMVAVAAVVAVAIAGVVYINNSVPQPAPQVAANANETPLALNMNQAAAGDSEILPAVTARIAGERSRANGFELRLEATERVPFEVLARSDNRIEVLLSGIDALSNQVSSLDGATVELVTGGLLVSIELDRESDFVVYENSNAFTYAVVIEGFWKVMPDITSVQEEAPIVPSTENTETPAVTAIENPAPPATTLTRTSQNENWAAAPLRTQRELSIQEKDRNASQQALRQAQSGQMQTAYVSLYDFISKNPEAHQSRNTLITLLYAQQQFDQVGLLVEEGLLLAPNQSSYKKMKARMLMMNGEYQQAISLMRNVPPAVAEDREYHELLASLYQQTGNYADAVSTYQELIRTDSNVGRWWTGMAISHESLGNITEAVNSFEVALQIPTLESSLRQYSRNRIRNLSGQ